ncbi:M28 family peptidase [Chitinophaga pendula]|uniref:M28 family peptidase n=1 Tax=Chitinophaga TaxID=79328 RepID=UPI0018DF4564|nr:MULTISPECIES: M28 family peptidase [Chitinophaga]UCJ06808.1 M28 family peptidase [Chitinophaga pendula]
MKKSTWLLPLLLATVTVQAQKKADRKALNNLQSHINYLAADNLEGRRTGTAGEQLAAAYIAAQMKQAGLQPKGDDGYLQTFLVREGKDIDAATTLDINHKQYTPGTHFIPLPFSAAKRVKGEIIPNVNEPENIWLIDVADFIGSNPHAKPLERYQQQVKEAVKDQATGVIFFNGKETPSEVRQWLNENTTPLSIPAIWTNDELGKLLGAEDANSFVVNMEVALKPTKRTGTNVIGYIDNGADKTIIIGAHYDHLGYGEDHNSLAPNDKAIHNGADDNASGTAALLELARMIKGSKLRNNNYLFTAFSGEELGLFGSKFLTEHSPIDLKQANFMINMDMVGRLDATKGLQIGGIGTSPTWSTLLQVAPKNLKITYDSSGTGPSDHTSFYRKEVPVLFFFTGSHADYHKPTDDADKINYEGELSIIRFIYDLIAQANDQPKLAFTKTREVQQATAGARFSVTLGIMPDYTYTKGGIRVDGVSEGKAAQKAGLATGDIILQLGTLNISDMESYMKALASFKKGDKTTVKIKRGNIEKTLPVQF